MAMMSSSTQIYLLRTDDLDAYRENYGKTKARAYCPIHGSNHQRSLDIELTGENRGFAFCHNCEARILLVDLNPDAEQRIREKDEREQNGLIVHAPIKIKVKKSVPRVENHQPSYDHQLLAEYRAEMQRALSYERPRAYLAQRGVPYDLAVEQGLMYLPDIPSRRLTPKLKSLSRWFDHIIFPLSSLLGEGFIGRSLRLWAPGMDEIEHRNLLKERKELTGDDMPPYLKTNPAGYFRFNEVVNQYSEVVIVEGPFDGMACLQAGITNVIALAGVALDAKMFPRSIMSVVIALDSDETGKAKSEKLSKDIRQFGIDTRIVTDPDDDGLGKDWSERYRRAGIDGLAPLLTPVVNEPTILQDISTEAGDLDEPTTEEAFECEDCHTPVPNPVPEDQSANPYYCFNVVYDASGADHCYCEYCRDGNGVPHPKEDPGEVVTPEETVANDGISLHVGLSDEAFMKVIQQKNQAEAQEATNNEMLTKK